MRVYLVRHIETKELQGVFWGTKAEVWDCVDELADPVDFEYAALSPGAIYTHAPIGKGYVVKQWDEREDDDDDDGGFYFVGFEGSEVTNEQIRCQSDLTWHRFDATDTGVGLVARIARKLAAEKVAAE